DPRFRPTVNITVEIDGEPAEHLIGLRPEQLIEDVAAQSAFIRLQAVDGATQEKQQRQAGGPTPRRVEWGLGPAGRHQRALPSQAYADAIDAMLQVPEVALVVLPDAYDQLPAAGLRDLVASFIPTIGACQDRMLLLDPPPNEEQAAKFLGTAPPAAAPLGA